MTNVFSDLLVLFAWSGEETNILYSARQYVSLIKTFLVICK